MGDPSKRVRAKDAGKKILAIDIGGHRIKVLVEGGHQPRKAPTGREFTPDKMMRVVRELTRGWDYNAVSIGFPGLVGDLGPKAETRNLGHGWVGFDYPRAFERPVRWANDAAMQALGSYEGGRMLFLGLGTGLGSALVIDRRILSLELGDLPFGEQTLGQALGRIGMKRDGKRRWRKTLNRSMPALQKILLADYVVLGGGNSRYVETLPIGVRIGNNLTAFRGGIRMWDVTPGTKHENYWTFL
ncbi:MAG TPA: ROK family protein [Planctomycetota bacterium]|nr:ROK family protein [Planctomycetota bacterium]